MHFAMLPSNLLAAIKQNSKAKNTQTTKTRHDMKNFRNSVIGHPANDDFLILLF